MKHTVVYSSLTGNTQKIAHVIENYCKNASQNVTMHHLEKDQDSVKADLEASDVIGIGYWVDKGTANSAIKALSEHIEGKKVYLFGTLGASPDSEHANKCKESIEVMFESNTVLGHFLCQGCVNPKLIESFKSLPSDHPHALTPERLARYEAIASKPDIVDLEAAEAFIKSVMSKVVI